MTRDFAYINIKARNYKNIYLTEDPKMKLVFKEKK